MRSTPFTTDDQNALYEDAIRTDRTIATFLMSWRWSGLATGLAATVAGRKRYRSRTVAAGQLIGAALESAWLARRFTRNGHRFDRRTRIVDPATAVAVLLVGRANVAAEDRWTWINWAPWSYANNAFCGRAVDADHRDASAFGAAAIIGATAVLADRWTDRIVNASGMVASSVATLVFARQVRTGAARLEATRANAIREEGRLAVEQERSRQLRLLHDRALQTLEAIGSGRHADLASIHVLARDDASRLRDELSGAPRWTRSLREELEAVVEQHTRHGLQIDLVMHGVAEAPAPVVGALRDACNEALVNVRKHAQTAHAQVTVDSHGGLHVTVQDHGIGFDPSVGEGFGTTHSITQRMADVGGRAEIDSAPGRPTRVTLWGPT